MSFRHSIRPLPLPPPVYVLDLCTKLFYTKNCSVENLCEHACPTLNHRAEYSHGCIQPRFRGFVSLDREFDSRADSVEHGFQLSNKESKEVSPVFISSLSRLCVFLRIVSRSA
jgi:hypothetical protein